MSFAGGWGYQRSVGRGAWALKEPEEAGDITSMPSALHDMSKSREGSGGAVGSGDKETHLPEATTLQVMEGGELPDLD